jgi:hypothetical protein
MNFIFEFTHIYGYDLHFTFALFLDASIPLTNNPAGPAITVDAHIKNLETCTVFMNVAGIPIKMAP